MSGRAIGLIILGFFLFCGIVIPLALGVHWSTILKFALVLVWIAILSLADYKRTRKQPDDYRKY